MQNIQRRGFLKKSIAALLPAAAAATIVGAQAEAVDIIKPETPKPSPQLNKKHSTIRNSSLKGDRHLIEVDTSFFCDTVAQRGMAVEIARLEYNPMGGQYAVVRPGKHSGQPIGILLNDVVNTDFSQGSGLSFNREKVTVGSKVTVFQQGTVLVGSFDEDVIVGEKIFYNSKGNLTTKPNGRPIGTAMSSSDEDGFVKVRIELYMNESAELSIS